MLLKIAGGRVKNLLASLPSAVAVFEDRYFAFGTLQDPADILLVCKYNHQCHNNRKNPVQGFFLIKNKENKHHKRNACQY